MIQEYLFSDKSKQADVLNYKPQNVDQDFADFKSTDCWMITYSVSGNSEDAARLLSDVNEYVLQAFNPVVLANGSAEYFNKMLFPIINEFERKLRKLLYLKSALNKDEKAQENIKDLEEKDLGTIFEFLFTDGDFVKAIRLKIKSEITWQFSKDEIINIIKKYQEHTLWDKLIGINSVPDLRNKYLCVKDYRNDIMHAHNINYQAFKEARLLFQKINKQLDSEIGIVISMVEKANIQSSARDYNSILNEALMKENMKEIIAQIEQRYDSFRVDVGPAISALEKMGESFESLGLNTLKSEELQRIMHPFSEWEELKKRIEASRPIVLSDETLEKIRRACEIPPNYSMQIEPHIESDQKEEKKLPEGEEKPNGSHEI